MPDLSLLPIDPNTDPVPEQDPVTPDPYPVTDPVPEPGSPDPHPEPGTPGEPRRDPEPFPMPPEPIPQYPPDVTFIA